MADEMGHIRELSRPTEETLRYGGAPIDRRGEYARSELRELRGEMRENRSESSERVKRLENRVGSLAQRVAYLEGYIKAERDGEARALRIGIGVALLIATISVIINVIGFLV